jgi:hypothetical protein
MARKRRGCNKAEVGGGYAYFLGRQPNFPSPGGFGAALYQLSLAMKPATLASLGFNKASIEVGSG